MAIQHCQKVCCSDGLARTNTCCRIDVAGCCCGSTGHASLERRAWVRQGQPVCQGQCPVWITSLQALKHDVVLDAFNASTSCCKSHALPKCPTDLTHKTQVQARFTKPAAILLCMQHTMLSHCELVCPSLVQLYPPQAGSVTPASMQVAGFALCIKCTQ
jgi:hypothetical protein